MKNSFEHTPKAQQRFDIMLAIGLTLITWAQLFVVWLATRSIGQGGQLSSVGGGIVTVIGFHQRSILVTIVLATLCCIPLIWRRRSPLVVLAMVTVAQCAITLWTHDPLPTFIAPLIALYTVGTMVSTRRLIIATILTMLALLGANQFVPLPGAGSDAVLMQQSGQAEVPPAQGGIIELPIPPHEGVLSSRVSEKEPPVFVLDFVNLSRGRDFVNILQVIASVVAFAALGRMTRLRKENVAEVEARAVEAQHAREEAALRRAKEERLRIARELHDITAHSLAAVIVQAGAAEALAESGDVQAATEIIATIRETTKRSLDELRHTVGILREENTDDDVPLSPEVSLDGIDTLLDSFRSAGLPIEMAVLDQNEPSDLAHLQKKITTAVEIATYRVVQESLTNVLRHSIDPTTVTVCLAIEDQDFLVEICNDGVVTDQEGNETLTQVGHGISGMRERIEALGGMLEAGVVTSAVCPNAVTTGDRFKVTVKVPV